MVKSFLAKKKSKRMTCRRKYKIDQKVKEHNRKIRKDGKEKLKKGGVRHRKKPDVQVPNKCPFKEDILKEAQQLKQQQEEAKQKAKEQLHLKRKNEKNKLLAEKRNLKSMVDDAQNRQATFELTNAASTSTIEKTVDGFNSSKSADVSLKVFYSEVKKVIERADVVIEVLDARDPLGSRSADIEKAIVESGKRLVLLLNKIDLIPKDNVIAWLKYLRNEFPAVAFKASTQEQNSRLGRAGHSIVSTSKCIGADLLMKLLGNYCRNKDIKTSICVGIVGFPNVGKSSVINSLKRKAACNVGALPGITKTLQEVNLDKKIRLLDSPGVAICSKEMYDRTEMALKNAVRVDLLEDPVLPVEAILRKCTRDNLMLQYNIGSFEDADEFLSQIARKIGRLKKGGVPDRRMAARKVLHDWNSGKIRYYTVPPETATGVEMISAQLVTEMSKEFDIDSIDAEQKVLVDELPNLSQASAIVLPAWKDVVKIDQSALQSSAMDSDTPQGTTRTLASFSKSIMAQSSKGELSIVESEMAEGTTAGNMKLNKRLQQKFKKQKKQQRRTDKVASALSLALDSAMEIDGARNDNYDFDTDFK